MLKAKGTFMGHLHGRDVLVHKGQTISDDHPIARAYPSLFEDPSPDIKMWDDPASGVEEATVNPGEVRSITPRPEVNDTLSIKDLRIIAKHETGKDYGTKEDLIHRILRHRGE